MRCMRTAARRRVPNARAFTLVEAAVSIVLVGVLLVTSLDLLGAVAMGHKSMGDRGDAQLLALGLMSEILAQYYEEPDDTPVFGRETSESGGERADYDDVDDYHNWTSSPPETKDGTGMGQLTGWERSVTVEYVQPEDPTTTSGTDTGVKRITVTVSYNNKPLATMVAVRTSGM